MTQVNDSLYEALNIPIQVIEDLSSAGLSAGLQQKSPYLDVGSPSASEIEPVSSRVGTSFVPLIRDNTHNVPSVGDKSSIQLSCVQNAAAVLSETFHYRKGPFHTDQNTEIEVKIREKTRYEEIDDMSNPILKALLRVLAAFSEICQLIISHPFFEFFIIFVILLNTFALALEDPLAEEQDTTLMILDSIFLYVYTVEAALKIGGLGFLFSRKAYLKDIWNVLDFTIVVSAWIEHSQQGGVNLTALRVLRVLRPLRGISSIEGLRVLITALISSIQPLFFSIVVLLAFLCIFAIAGLQLWMGVFKYRCVNINDGILGDDSMLCGNYDCPIGYECAVGLDNPNYGVTNFDNVLYAFLAVFQCITLEEWTWIMIAGQKAFSYYVVFYFVPLVFIGAFLMLNFILAVIKYHFTIAMDNERSLRAEKEEVEEDLDPEMIEQSPDRKLMIAKDAKILKFGDIHKEIVRLPQRQHFEMSPLVNYSRHNNEVLDNSSNFALAKLSTYNKGQQIMRESPSFRSESGIKFKHQFAKTLTGPTRQRAQTHKSKETLVTMLAQQGGSVKLKKELLSKIKDKKTLDKYILMVNEDNIHLSSSAEDVMVFDDSNLQPNYFEYAFEYIFVPADEYHHNTTKIAQMFNSFRIQSLKLTEHEAFFEIVPSAYNLALTVTATDLVQKPIYAEWSGSDVNSFIESEKHMRALNYMKFRLWRKGYYGYLDRFTYPITVLVDSKIFMYAMTLAVFVNTIVLSMDHYGISNEMEEVLVLMNNIFTITFTIEMVLKLIGMGFIGYFRDPMNYIDAAVVIISIVELAFLSQNTALTAFRTVRIFRTFRVLRVLRVARLFRYLKSMADIIKVLSNSIYSFIYLALLLLLFVTIFTLLGMQIFGGEFDFPEGTPRANFDSFHNAFVTVFQILSMEDWQSVLYNAMRSPAGSASCLFFIAWIFLGNFVILNLFLAIVLDSFDQEITQPDEKEEEEDDIAKQRRRSSLFKPTCETKRKKQEARHFKTLGLLENEDESLEKLKEIKSHPKEKDLFQGIYCEKSYFLFSKENKFRVFCHKIANSPSFENGILLLICLSSSKLVWDTYLLDEPDDSGLLALSEYFDIGFTVAFTVEMLLKSINMGFFMDRGSYLRDSWNFLDFVIVVFSIIEISIQSLSLPFIKVLRLLRTLRPLRFISHNLSMKLVVTALLESLFAILNVLIVLFIVWLIFAILGVSLFSGKFYSCENPKILTQELCSAYGFDWVNADSNYDNILEALLTLFVVSTLEGWPEIMHQGVDAREEDLAPEKDHNPAAAYYFIAFIFIGSFFFVNLFIGVVFMQFNQAKKNESSSYSLVLSEKQLRWIELQNLIVNSKPIFDVHKEPYSSFRLVFYTVSKHVAFEIFIMGCILLNMLQMAIAYQGASSDYVNTLEILNLCFTIIFILEAIIKMIGLGPKGYFNNNWNVFDFVVVIASIVDLSISFFFDSETSILTTAPQLARVIRVLRVSRLFRIFRALRPLQDLVMVMAVSLPAILNVLSLLVLLFFIYAVLGVFIFYQVESGEIIDDFTNFSNFGMAMIALLRISTGENWNLIMYDMASREGILVSTLYFCSFITVTTFIMLNLFVMVIVQSYQDYKKNPKNALQIFNSDLKKFKRAWATFSTRFNGLRMQYRDLPKFMKVLGDSDPKLGVTSDFPYNQIINVLSTMDLFIEEDGFVYYNDLLFAVMRRRHYKKKRINKGELSKKIMKKEHQSSSRHLTKARVRIKNSFQNGRSTIKENKQNKQEFFFTMFYAKTVFKSWKKWVIIQRRKRLIIEPSPASLPGMNSYVESIQINPSPY